MQDDCSSCRNAARCICSAIQEMKRPNDDYRPKADCAKQPICSCVSLKENADSCCVTMHVPHLSYGDMTNISRFMSHCGGCGVGCIEMLPYMLKTQISSLVSTSAAGG